MNTVELREQRAAFVADARKLIDLADSEKRDVSAEENAQIDKLFSEADKLGDKINTAEKREAVEQAEARLKATEERKVSSLSSRQLRAHEDKPNTGNAIRSWLTRGRGGRISGADLDNAARCGIDLSSPELQINPAGFEKRDMNTGAGTAGQDLVLWTEFFNGFYEKTLAYGPVLGLVNVHTSSTGNDLPIPIMDDTANSAEILSETNTVAAADPATDSRVLGAFKYSSKEVVLSLELLQDSSINVESYVQAALASRFGRKWAADITTGVGTTEPFGLCGRSTASGISVAGTQAIPAPVPDDLLDLADHLDESYRGNAGVGYMMHRNTATKLRKTKASTAGTYLWQPSLQAGQPDSFNGYPVYVNQSMPYSGDQKVIVLFGDFKAYTWRQVKAVQFFRLQEYRIRSGQISFLAFARADGDLINTSAMVNLKSPHGT